MTKKTIVNYYGTLDNHWNQEQYVSDCHNEIKNDQKNLTWLEDYGDS